MTSASVATGYARLKPLQARAVLAALLLTTAFCAAVTLSPLARGRHDEVRPGAGDAALFRAIVDRIGAGEGYYQATLEEMRARGYPTRSVFNWRTPLPIWLIGRMPDPVLGKALLGLLALAVAVLSFQMLAREDGGRIGRAVGCVLLLSGPLMFCALGDIFVMPVLWSGVCIALSICGYGVGRPYLGVAMGLLALFLRELALPYCVLAAGLAWRDRRPGEAAAWLVGLAAWGVFVAFHWMRVVPLIPPDARVHHQGWIQFGGAAFVISTVEVNAYLLLLPQWVTAAYFVAAMFGFAGWHTRLGTRIGLSVCLYVAAFAVAGQEFNQYWGALVAPLFCFGLVRFPASLRDLWKAAATGHHCRSGWDRGSPADGKRMG